MMGRILSRSQSPRYPCPAERLVGKNDWARMVTSFPVVLLLRVRGARKIP